MKKLKPIVFRTKDETGTVNRANIFQQNILLKALAHTSDLEELRKLANFHSKNEVLRTLDKLAIRRDFHHALANNGLTPDFLVQRLFSLASSPSDKVALGAVQTTLKSIGLDKYETTEAEGKDWEGLLLKINEKEQAAKSLDAPKDKVIEGVVEEYEVVIPEVPESAKKKRDEDNDIGKSIYE